MYGEDHGSSYLPVRELSELLGKDVDFKDGVIKLNTPKAEVIETTYKELRAIKVGDETYFNWKDYLDKYEADGYAIGIDIENNRFFYAKRSPNGEVEKVYDEYQLDVNFYAYKGMSHINVKYYKDPADLKPAE